MPQLSGDGYAARALIKGDETFVQIDGKRYHRLIFRTVLTPSRAGKLTVGPVNLRLLYSKRLGARNDIFGAVFERAKEHVVTAEGVNLDVLPLPLEGRPKDFTGAIGSFQFSATGSPSVVKAGDPLVMKLNVSGQGNFDRISAPTIAEPAGWRSYPPTEQFAGKRPTRHDWHQDILGRRGG